MVKHIEREECSQCDGSGDCSYCDGDGEIRHAGEWVNRKCSSCSGSGKCPGCGGSGFETEPDEYNPWTD